MAMASRDYYMEARDMYAPQRQMYRYQRQMYPQRQIYPGMHGFDCRFMDSWNKNTVTCAEQCQQKWADQYDTCKRRVRQQVCRIL